MNIFVFDNTFEGLLTSVFEAYSRRVFPDALSPEGEPLPLFHDEVFIGSSWQVMKKAQYFITCHELPMKTVNEMTPQAVRSLLITKPNKKKVDERQLLLDFHD